MTSIDRVAPDSRGCSRWSRSQSRQARPARPSRHRPARPTSRSRASTVRTCDCRSSAGSVVMINFWATWCGPCRVEMPHLAKLYEKYRGSGFTVLAVNIDEDPHKAASLAKQLGMRFPVLLDTEKKVSRLYDLSTMPSTVLVDRDGRVRYVTSRLPRRLRGNLRQADPGVAARMKPDSSKRVDRAARRVARPRRRRLRSVRAPCRSPGSSLMNASGWPTRLMKLQRDPLSAKHFEHVHEVREGSRGGTGVQGGGCGCN